MRFSLLMAGVVLAASPAFADDWPQWRGPNRDEISKETGLNTNWKAHQPKLLWTNKEAGAGYSSPAIVGGTLYCLGAEDGKDFAFALDAATGGKKWKQSLGTAPKKDRGDGPRGTPTVDGGALYFVCESGELYCLDAATGKVRWNKRFVEDLGGEIMSGWGYSESPLVDGNLVVCTPGGQGGAMVAFNKETGKEVWRCTELTEKAAYSSIIVAEVDGVRQFIQLVAKGVTGVRAKDGKLLWYHIRKGYQTAVIPTAIYFDGNVFATAGYGAGCDLIQLTKDGDKFTAKNVYAEDNMKNMVNHHGGVVLVDGHIYGYSDGKGWICQDLKSGDIVWKDKKLGKGALTCAAGHLFCYEENSGTLACVKISTKGWEETGRLELPEKTKIKTRDNKYWAHPVIANGKLYVRHQDLLFCFDLKDSLAAH
jgi:outer membrane protein assembly factor BamB